MQTPRNYRDGYESPTLFLLPEPRGLARNIVISKRPATESWPDI